MKACETDHAAASVSPSILFDCFRLRCCIVTAQELLLAIQQEQSICSSSKDNFRNLFELISAVIISELSLIEKICVDRRSRVATRNKEKTRFQPTVSGSSNGKK